ncbi:LAME_0F03730g1_1 [Lachancea meyersii CBS 8951]|uniref:LAME_0F03730g1_1 n=1 Tax=Lachancea meyersii CBS 8951 TaxID=1266667 RepID=A0A1G4JRQ3_9SACH|nr:LAME_0F03730g1_1 [Lachancea meyersii CBS 8951]
MQGSIYSSPFPALNPRVRYKTALERAGFDTIHNRPQRAPEREKPYLAGRHVSEGGSALFGMRSEPRLTRTEPNSKTRAVSAKEPHPRHDGFKMTELQQELPTARQLNQFGETGLSQRPPVPQSQFVEHNNGSLVDEQVYRNVGVGSSIAAENSSTRNKRESSVFDFEKKRTSIDPVEKSFLQLTQTSNYSNASSQERVFTPYETESTTSVNVSDEDDFEDAHSQRDPTEETPSMDKWRSIMRYSGATQDNSQYEEPAQLEGPEGYDLNATPHSKRQSESSISFTPVAELHVNLSPQKTSEPALMSLPVISVSADEQEETLPPLPAVVFKPDSRTTTKEVDTAVSDHEETIEPLKPLNIKSKSVQHQPSQSHEQEVSQHALNYSGYKLQDNIQIDENEIEPEEAEETLDDFDPSSTLKSSLQVEKLLAQLDDISTNRNLAVGSPRPNLTSRFKKSSAYLSGFIPAATEVDTAVEDSLQPNAILQNDTQSFDVTDYKPQSIRLANDAVEALKDELSTDSDGSPKFFKFRQDLGALQKHSSDTGATGSYSGIDNSDSLMPSERLKHSSNNTISLRERTAIPTSVLRQVDENKNDHPSDTGMADGTDHTESSIPHKYPPGQGPCRACGLEVTSKSIYSKKEDELSGQWHRGCFSCIKCDVKFSKRVPCFILDDQPYCQMHFHIANNSICQICHQFIEGECLENDRDERFHAECLRCFRCQNPIREDYYLFNYELPLCHNHDIEALKLEALSEFGDTTTISKRRTRIVNFT